jgi:signal transduction histidine kinase
VGSGLLVLTLALGVALVAGAAATFLFIRRRDRVLRRTAEVVGRMAGGDLTTEVPSTGTGGAAALAAAIERMRREIAERIGNLELERGTHGAILSGLDEGIILFGADGSVLYQNDTAARLLGPLDRLQQLLPATFREAVEAAAADRSRRVMDAATGPGSRSLAGVAAGISGDDRVLLVLRDVTEARALDAVRRDFVANASHELKTPAASIRALAETIQTAADDDSESVPRFAAQLEREALRLSRIISDLLDLSRLEGEPGEREDVRLDRVVSAEAERAKPEGELAGLTVSVSADSPVVVMGSRHDLALMVRNLLQNAVQYTRPGGRVDVEVRPEDGQAILVIRDTGVGIPRKDRGRVFERFYRVDRARSRETGGTGLGLSIVKHVVENHGGSVQVDSRLGEGSAFTVRLPLATRT